MGSGDTYVIHSCTTLNLCTTLELLKGTHLECMDGVGAGYTAADSTGGEELDTSPGVNRACKLLLRVVYAGRGGVQQACDRPESHGQ